MAFPSQQYTYSSATATLDTQYSVTVYAADSDYTTWVESDTSVSDAFSADYDGLAIRAEIWTEVDITLLSDSISTGPHLCLY